MQGNLYYGIISVAGLELKMGCTLNQVLTVLKEYIKTIKKYEYNEFYMEQDSRYYEVFFKEPVIVGELTYSLSLVFDKEKQVLRKYKLRHFSDEVEVYEDRRNLEVELAEDVLVDDYEEAVGISYDNDYIFIRLVYDKLQDRYDFSVSLKYDKFKRETYVEFKGDLSIGIIEYSGLILRKGTTLQEVEEVLENEISEAKEFSILDEKSGMSKEFIEIGFKNPIVINEYKYILQAVFELERELLVGYRLIYAENDGNFNNNHNMLANMIGMDLLEVQEEEDTISISYSNNEINLYSDYGSGYEEIFIDIDIKYNIEEVVDNEFKDNSETTEEISITYDEISKSQKIKVTESKYKKDIRVVTYALVIIMNIIALIISMVANFLADGITTPIMNKAIQTGIIFEVVAFVGVTLVMSIPGIIVIVIGYFISLNIIKKNLKLEVDRKAFKNRYTYATMIAIVIIWGLMMFF